MWNLKAVVVVLQRAKKPKEKSIPATQKKNHGLTNHPLKELVSPRIKGTSFSEMDIILRQLSVTQTQSS
jgi:hypothetical protein